ncbi:receptor-type tyrosine-protein phosphatase mu [Limosa lapponica baueri]|uniref:Receptor-type tyrosine-protein phosphatase mu n=1 Tax=Limosa lapponica baueri TaxID=1758121 RepID=A0A2I0UPA9_LIMLA|nr:receptor-type tyrosine-protein phosphatase mu [Limosa lapponica baueri]
MLGHVLVIAVLSELKEEVKSRILTPKHMYITCLPFATGFQEKLELTDTSSIKRNFAAVSCVTKTETFLETFVLSQFLSGCCTFDEPLSSCGYSQSDDDDLNWDQGQDSRLGTGIFMEGK